MGTSLINAGNEVCMNAYVVSIDAYILGQLTRLSERENMHEGTNGSSCKFEF